MLLKVLTFRLDKLEAQTGEPSSIKRKLLTQMGAEIGYTVLKQAPAILREEDNIGYVFEVSVRVEPLEEGSKVLSDLLDETLGEPSFTEIQE